MNLFSPKGFLLAGGLLLILLGVLSYIQILGTSPERSIFGQFWWFDMQESIIFTIAGVVGVVCAFILPAIVQRYLVIIVGVIEVVIGLYTFVSPTLFLLHLEVPVDMLFHLLLGVWALYAVFGNVRKTR